MDDARNEPESNEHLHAVLKQAALKWMIRISKAIDEVECQDRAREIALLKNVDRWPRARLQNELNRLRARYFPHLTGTWTISHDIIPTRPERLETDASGSFVIHPRYESLGNCDQSGHITVDLCRREHCSSRQVRATLLHELCHAACPERSHGVAFLSEVERLLREQAPVYEFFLSYGDEWEMTELLAELPECRRWYLHQRERAEGRPSRSRRAGLRAKLFLLWSRQRTSR